MTRDEMIDACRGRELVTFVFPARTKRPAGFPRGELLCETPSGRVVQFDARKVLAWLTQ